MKVRLAAVETNKGYALAMWKTIGSLSLLCAIFIALLITLSIVGIQGS